MPDMHSPIVILLLSLFAGAIRVSTPYLFVSLGECLTEKGGRVNLGLEGILVSGRDERLCGLLSVRLAVDRRAGRRCRRACCWVACTDSCARCRAYRTLRSALR